VGGIPTWISFIGLWKAKQYMIFSRKYNWTGHNKEGEKYEKYNSEDKT